MIVLLVLGVLAYVAYRLKLIPSSLLASVGLASDASSTSDASSDASSSSSDAPEQGGPVGAPPPGLSQPAAPADAARTVPWVANKRFEISKFKFKFPRARTYKIIGLVLGCIEANSCK